MTDHSTAIDRALERLENDPWPKTRTSRRMWFTSILTDLAAEIERPLLQRIARLERENFGERARLAAVVKYAHGCKWSNDEVNADDILALARGEGGSDE